MATQGFPTPLRGTSGEPLDEPPPAEFAEMSDKPRCLRPPRGSPMLASRRLSISSVPSSRPLSPAGPLSPVEPEGSPLLGVEMSAVLMVYLVNFMDSLGGNISTPILPFYGQELGASSSQIGALFSVFAFAQTAAMPALGWMSDRYGRRAVLLLSISGASLGALSQGLATSYCTLLAARAFSGIWAGVSSVCQVYITDVVPPEMRTEYLGYHLASTQASILFGPSIGAGLSVLGLNVPILTQAAVAATLIPLVFVYLPESPEWLQLHRKNDMYSPDRPMPSPSEQLRRVFKGQAPGVGKKVTLKTVGIFGVVMLCTMIAQMSIVSMFAAFAKDQYGLDSVRVGFCMTLGAISSIGTNIWVSPFVQRKLGNIWASVVGSLLMVLGSLGVVLHPLQTTLVSLMLAYLGIAISGAAVFTATANLTDAKNRSTVLMGVRMLKSLGAMVGPVLSGSLAGGDTRLPFLVAACSAALGGLWQMVTISQHTELTRLLESRQVVGRESALIHGQGWQDEFGTPEEIGDLGEFVANLLSTRHYRWVTYNQQLKNCLSDFFPPLPVESADSQSKAYDYVRNISRSLSQSGSQLLKNYEAMAMHHDAEMDYPFRASSKQAVDDVTPASAVSYRSSAKDSSPSPGGSSPERRLRP